MKKNRKYASIVKNYNGVDFYVCTIIQEAGEEDFSYTFIPNYSIINLIPKEEFDGIQSIDLSTNKAEFYFESIPTFIYERTPPKNRDNINEILKSLGLDVYDPLEILLRSKSNYIGDTLLIKEYQKGETIDYSSLFASNIGISAKNIIKAIAKNDTIVLNGKVIDNLWLYECMSPLYLEYLSKKRNEQLKGKEVRLNNKNYKGRPSIKIKDDEFLQIVNLYKNKSITAEKAASLLNISKRTFYRKLK